MALFAYNYKQPAVLNEQLRHISHRRRESAIVEPYFIGFTVYEELSHPGQLHPSFRQHLQVKR
jgi:hypothetical protein